MYLDADELRPCRCCGVPCDGDLCSSACEHEMWARKEAAEAEADDEETAGDV